MEKIFQVEGMMCQGCEKRVHQAVCSVSGVEDCKADASSNTVCVVFDGQKVNEDVLKKTIEDTGYDVVG